MALIVLGVMRHAKHIHGFLHVRASSRVGVKGSVESGSCSAWNLHRQRASSGGLTRSLRTTHSANYAVTRLFS